jgi:hypothetical protein
MSDQQNTPDILPDKENKKETNSLLTDILNASVKKESSHIGDSKLAKNKESEKPISKKEPISF